MAVAKHAVPDFWCYFGSDKLSDCIVELVEESITQQGKRKRQQTLDLKGHSMVLVAFSGYCKCKLDNWQDTAASSDTAKHRIEVPVPAGQLEVGQLLIKGMYQAQPDLAGVSQEQLLQLLLLADRYEVPKVLEAVSSALAAIPVDQLQWETVAEVYNLPAGCAELDACKSIHTAAAAKLQQELGDLELVWADQQGQKQQLLCALPHLALKQLLQDPGTRVASENTVFYTIQRWHAEQRLQVQRSRQLMDELVQLIRMKHCSQLYVCSVMSQSPLFTKCFSQYEMMMAACYSSTGAEDSDSDEDEERCGVFEDGKLAVLAKYPAWSADKRPASAMQQLTIEWKVKSSELQEALEQHLQDKTKAAHRLSEARVWQGQAVAVKLQIRSKSSSGTSTPGGDAFRLDDTHLGLFLYVSGLPAGALRGMGTDFKFIAAVGADIEQGMIMRGFSKKVRGWGCPDMVNLSSVGSWADVQGALCAKNLLHPDGCLHIQAQITEIR